MFRTDTETMMGRKERAYHHAFEASVDDLKPVGREKQNIAERFGCPEQKRKVLWLSDPMLPAPIDVHTVVVVENVHSACPSCMQQGYTIVVEPFDISLGKCVIIQDAAGIRICLLERTNASRSSKAARD
jgi:hypothetical protein